MSLFVQDPQGHAPEEFDFGPFKANGNILPNGIIALIDGETIKSITLENSGGFKAGKQFEFVGAPGVEVPEPAAWAMMLVGFGGLGGVLRSRRRAASSLSPG